tara:strand:+ start:484 stop:1170 length:687 start_codon:yes stop_codon:yes gene_type:complete
MSRIVISGVVILVIIITTTIVLMNMGENTLGPSAGPSAGVSVSQSESSSASSSSSSSSSSSGQATATASASVDPTNACSSVEECSALIPEDAGVEGEGEPVGHVSDVVVPDTDETPGDGTATGMLKCVNTRRRSEMGWRGKGRWKTESQARSLCSDFEYMSLECPNEHGFEVFCTNDISKAQTLLNRECKGDVEGTQLGGGTNSHCYGPYEWGAVHGGGANRGAVYKI